MNQENIPKEIKKITRQTKGGSINIFYRVTFNFEEKKFDKIFRDYDKAISFLNKEKPKPIVNKNIVINYSKNETNDVNEQEKANLAEKNNTINYENRINDFLEKLNAKNLNKKQETKAYIEIFKLCKGFQDFFNKIGLVNNAGNFYKFKSAFKELGFDTASIKRNGEKIDYFKDALIENSPYHRSSIKRFLIRENIIPYECSADGCSVKGFWNGKKISLQLEHKNGVPNDNRLENLTFLCPNCHSQTETFASRTKVIKNKNIEKRINIAKQHAIKKGGKCLSEEYDGANKKMLWKCHNINHQEWNATYSKVLSDGSWCPQCAREKNNENLRLGRIGNNFIRRKHE